jgi:hypothetical protein
LPSQEVDFAVRSGELQHTQEFCLVDCRNT